MTVMTSFRDGPMVSENVCLVGRSGLEKMA
jgi:hypothetical protein